MRNLVRFVALPLVLCALAAVTLPAQELAIAPPGSSHLTFDVIAIHPVSPSDPRRACSIKATPGGNGYLARCVNVKIMISLMYKIPARQITGAPDWVTDERFDIDARTDKSYNIDDLHTMFQNLLAERFGLKFHVEKKEGNIYALTIDSSGLKMKPNTTPEDFQIPVNNTIDGFTGIRVPMNYLCWQLGQFLQNDERPVINMTGLKGNYDFKISFLPELPPGFDKDSLPPAVLERPNLFTAVREQLGLKLTPQKGPVTYMVIDHVERASDN